MKRVELNIDEIESRFISTLELNLPKDKLTNDLHDKYIRRLSDKMEVPTIYRNGIFSDYLDSHTAINIGFNLLECLPKSIYLIDCSSLVDLINYSDLGTYIPSTIPTSTDTDSLYQELVLDIDEFKDGVYPSKISPIKDEELTDYYGEINHTNDFGNLLWVNADKTLIRVFALLLKGNPNIHLVGRYGNDLLIKSDKLLQFRSVQVSLFGNDYTYTIKGRRI